MIVGVVALITGAAAFAIQEAFKLDTAAALTGQYVLGDGVRVVLAIGGISLAVLGVLLVLLGTLAPERARPLSILTWIVLVPVVALTGIVLVDASHDSRSASASSDVQQEANDTSTIEPTAVPSSDARNETPSFYPSGAVELSCGSGGCWEGSDKVWPPTEGESCLRGRAAGTWMSLDAGAAFTCIALENAKSARQKVDPGEPVVCESANAGCYQADHAVSPPTEGAECSQFETWVVMPRIGDPVGDLFMCAGD